MLVHTYKEFGSDCWLHTCNTEIYNNKIWTIYGQYTYYIYVYCHTSICTGETKYREGERGGGPILADSHIRKKQHEKTEKYQELKEQLTQVWKVNAKVVPVVTGALEEWLQQVGATSEVSVQSRSPGVQSEEQL